MKLKLAGSILLLSALCISAFSQTSVSVAGLSAPVMVSRDGRSIPYIEAKTDADLYFAQGYTVASDRLWQMDLLRRLARGETAEIFGQMTLEEDKRWRRYGFATIADESVALLSPELRAALDNYARGVNAYIASLTDKTLPVEFRILQYKPREWTPSDTVAVGKIIADGLSTTWRNDLMRASVQDLSKDKLADILDQVTPYDVVLFGKDEPARAIKATRASIVSEDVLAAAEQDERIRERSLARVGFYAEELAASNNWVISGKRTTDGKPLLANDPHLAASCPGIWYLAHLSTPTTRVSGVTFPGVPGIVLGHNEHFAWGATNVGPDVQDLYLETFNDAGEYRSPSGWQKPEVRKETIRVRTNLLDTKTSPVEMEYQETRNGIVIHEEAGKKYSLKWTARDPRNSEFGAFFSLNRAKDWEQFKSALSTYGGPTQNFIFADVKGNIGWYAAGKIPIRKTGDGALPYDGSTNDGEWAGTIPFDEMPHLYNPPSGLIVTANQRIVGTSYKYTQMSRDAAAPWRARRIQDLLDVKRKLDADYMNDVQHDAYSIPHHNLAKAIVKNGMASAATLAVLEKWDGRMMADSQAALLVNEIRVCAANAIADANKPVPGYVIRERVLDRAVRDQLSRWLPAGVASYKALFQSCDASTRASFADAKRFGPDETKWTWGRAWQSRFQHPLAQAPLIGMQFATPAVPIDGSGVTPNVGSNVSMRLIASPGNWDTTRHVIPLGQSGDPASVHFKDQFDMWRTGAAAIFPFSSAAVDKARVSQITMTPKN